MIISQENSNHNIQTSPVVGIGTSVGGIDALKKMIKEIPADSGMAYIVAMNLPTDEEDIADILSSYSKIPVMEIINEVAIFPDHIYIIPTNKTLTTEYGILKLSARSRNEKKHLPIDTFFTSLAEVYNSLAIGIVLSGTVFDGTVGLKVIKEFGGATLVQDPETAAYRMMPQSAIDADAVDYVLAPEKMALQLLEIRQSYEKNYGYTEIEHIPDDEEEILKQIIKIIHSRTSNDFRHYKQPTIRRRIARRMVLNKKEELSSYLNYLRNDKAEQDLLFNDLLIPVSYFFRDTQIFESLNHTIFPQLLQNVTNKTLRIWVAGCSTGEEAYSLAICIHEFLADKKEDIKVQIFASDISENVITQARAAAYSLQDLQNVSPTRLANYFTKRDGNYHINKVIRDMCVFAVHNFIKDPPFAKIDLVSCRNVLIYFDSFLQNKAFSTFHYALRENGFLFIGKSESAAGVSNLFETVGKHEKIYIKKNARGRFVPEAFRPIQVVKESTDTEQKSNPESDFRKVSSDILFSKYTPASVVINNYQEIVHFHGDTGPFLLPSPGKPNFNILKMAREGISFELRNMLMKVQQEKEPLKKENIRVKNQNYLADIEVVPLNNDDDHILIVFKKTDIIAENEDEKIKRKTNDQKRILELENELSQLRDDIKRVTEEQQTAFEELQTSNEELLSSSEELQALNEELETSTEELQSNNEELVCVNDELMDRQEQLIALRNYAESIIRTVREPLIILDKELRIKSANPAFYKYFKTTEAEVEGKSFFEIGANQWDIPGLSQLLKDVLVQTTSIDDYKIKKIFPVIGERNLILNARRVVVEDRPAEMILLTLQDVTDIESINEKLSNKNSELELYNEQLQSFSWAASHDLQEPLRKISMFAKKIVEEDKGLSEKSQYNLDRIIVSTENMRQLIDDLMSYTRTIVIEKELKRTDLNLLVKKTITDLKDIIKEKEAVINTDALPRVEVLPQQFQQLFSNLIINSIKYSKEDTRPEITITAEKTSKEEMLSLGGNPELNYIKILVSDNGIGFSDTQSERIFDAFFRLHSKDKFRGSGLGLALCKKIVQNHNGFIKASGKIDEGAVFTIYIPS